MTAEYKVHGDVAVITLVNPPVNGLGLATRQGITNGLTQANADPAVKAIVLTGGGKAFSGGADIKEFGSPKALAEPNLLSLIKQLDNSPKVVVAAINGTCMGGGLELALGAHYRLASPGVDVALPEVKIGLLPGAGGTQRLPRIVGAAIEQGHDERGIVFPASIAPFGGLDPVFTPNPMSVGIPTSGLPVLIDVSTSSTTNGMTNRLFNEKKLLPAAWVMDGHGQASADPAVLFDEPKGTILPLGGMDSGHKGYGLSLMVEAMTGGLAGHGRADPAEGWGATVFLQIIDPQAFAGLNAFERQVDHLVERCQNSKTAKQGEKVRLPGERGLRYQADSKLHGLALYASIMPALVPWAEKLNVTVPQAV